MLKNSRALIKEKMDDGVLVDKVINASYSMKEMVEVICFMKYYFVGTNDIFQECLELFANYQESVKKEIYDAETQNTDGEYTIEMALSEAFIRLVNKEVNDCQTESNIPSVVQKVIEFFFKADRTVSLDDEEEIDYTDKREEDHGWPWDSVENEEPCDPGW